MAGLLPGATPATIRAARAADAPARPFDDTTVREIARELATKPFAAPDERLPAPLSDLGYDQYRTIQYDAKRALWRAGNLPFQMQPFHRGFLYKQRVELFEVANGRARPIAYDASGLHLGTRRAAGRGPRLRRLPPDQPDEPRRTTSTRSPSFLGASYFRAVGKGPGLRPLRPRPRHRDRRAGRARSSRSSAPSGSSARGRAATPSWCTRCSTARASPAPSASPSARARRRCSTWRRASSRAPRSTTAGIAPLTSMFLLRPARPPRRRRLPPGGA